MLIFAHSGLLPLNGADGTIGAALLWGALTIYLWVAIFALDRALWSVFLTLYVRFFLLGFGARGDAEPTA